MGVQRALLWLLIATVSCAAPPRWQSTQQPDALDAAELLASDRLGVLRDERPDEVPVVPIRTTLRPCCAFGSGLRVRVAGVVVPGLAIGNIKSADSIGQHRYDAGELRQNVSRGSEHNGLVYTCRGGFIDTAHVRDYADWTLYVASQIGRKLEKGGMIVLPEAEGGIRRIYLQPINRDLLAALGRRQVTASLAVWLGFQLSLWHEIATWYGWASYGMFSERASAFSPEDLYSNLLGAKIAGPIITSGNDLSEDLFNEAVDVWFAQSLDFLGALDADIGEEAMAAVDGVWWDSSARLPDANLVLRRSIQSGRSITPWVVPLEAMPAETRERVEASCDNRLAAHALRHPNRRPGLDYEDVLTLEIELDDRLKRQAAFAEYGDFVRNDMFPAILDEIRNEARSEFGRAADSPAFD